MANVDVVVGASDAREDVRDRMLVQVQTSIGLVGGTLAAQVSGTSVDETWGTEHAVWVAASVPADGLDDLRAELSWVARTFGQDAVALTVGAVELVEG